MFSKKSWRISQKGRLSPSQHFFVYGIPFFAIILVSTAMMSEVYKTKYNADEEKNRQAVNSVPFDVGLKKKSSSEELEVYEKLIEEIRRFIDKRG